jgi:FixJ family two-component response regulator
VPRPTVNPVSDFLSYHHKDRLLSNQKARPRAALIINIAFASQSGLKLKQTMNQHG